MKKFLASLLLSMSIISSSLAFELPDEISSWHSVSEHVVNITPTSTGENLGRVVYRDYSRGKSTLQIILTEGAGAGELYVPERVNDLKGVMSSEADYKVLEVAGCKSILEVRSFMPVALAVRLDDNSSLTIESFALNEAEIVKFAEDLINLL
ncbi:MAG: hypothetical protein IJU48_02160 [Synergistaceae bacterium]|nr:hypothetical protein [Synergistaceae bacterium]